MSWLRHVLGIRSDEEIIEEVESEPSVRAARKQLDRARAIFIELEKVDQGPRPARRDRRKGDRNYDHP